MNLRNLAGCLLFALGVLNGGARAQPVLSTLDNLDFEQGEIGKLAPGWSGRTAATSYVSPQAGAKSALVTNTGTGFASFSKALAAAPYRGQYLRFRAAVRTDAPDGAGLWLRVDSKQGTLFLDNMGRRPVRSPDWTWAEIKVSVPPEAEYIVLGGIINGPGTAGFDSASLEILPESTDRITPEAEAYLNRALDLLQGGHINKLQADWPALRRSAAAAAAHAQTPVDTYAAIQVVVGELGDRHTMLLPPGTDMQRLAAGASPPALAATRLGEQVVKLVMPGTAEPLGGTYDTTLRALIAQHQEIGACGWIIDLRGNGGGNVFPMLNGLAPLLGPLPWGGFRNADGALTVWTLRDERVGQASAATFLQPSTAPAAALKPVAVLLGPRTTSSGETAAIALAGRVNARSFGAATAGLTTGNVVRPLSDGATLLLTTSRELDRMGQVVDGPVRPDQATAASDAEPEALAWLAGKGCR